ncbi:hypothetical protein FFLO_00541 [Filobasidium floriforme]|uniref:Oligopeptide transporter n=1 Tax=Filobasidium floriforme TaxID=5210 RepID=A0A8K0NQU6_9TREE|nr:hypothetical protein FFLO_00541 [Filobasidium floriforme]
MLCDQSPVKRSTIKVLKSGERVILSPQVTVQRYLLVFYWAINVGAFFGLATSYAAYNVGFWLAFLTPGIFYMLMPLVLWVCYKRLVRFAPQGSVVLEAFKACRSLFKDGNSANLFKRGNAFWENARPSAIASRGGDLSGVTWDDKFIDDLQRTMAACKVFRNIPIFNLANSGLGNSVNAMSSAMTLGGVPNDLIQNWNALTIVCCAPLINYGLYPAFSKMGYPISPMWRMTIGFTLGGLNMIYGGVLQTRVFLAASMQPVTECALGVSPISLWLQVPLFSLPALGEIFVNVTSYELAYTRAPPRMKGLVYAFCLFTTAISSAIGLACSAAVTDPYLVEPYWVLAALSLACGLDKEVNFFDPSLTSIKQDKAEVDVEETREKR